MSLQSALAWVQTQISGVNGIRSAPEYPPENVGAFPFVGAIASDGSFIVDTDDSIRGEHNIMIDLHLDENELHRDIKTIAPFIESIPAVIYADRTLDGNADTFQSIDYAYIPNGEWGSVKTRVYRFTIRGVTVLGSCV